MTDSVRELHQQFDQDVIRNTLATMLERGSYFRAANVESIKRQIAKLQQDLKNAEASVTAYAFMEHLGWNAHDVSDHVPKDIIDGQSMWLPFVGTDADYEKVKMILGIE